MKSTLWCSVSVIPILEEPAKTIWCLVNKNLLSMCRSTFNFYDFLETFNITLLGTESWAAYYLQVYQWFLWHEDLKTKVKVWLPCNFCNSPAGDQFWKFSRQCSIFGALATSESQFRALFIVTLQPKNNACARTSFCICKKTFFLRLIVVTWAWVLETARTSLQLHDKSVRTSLRQDVRTARTSLQFLAVTLWKERDRVHVSVSANNIIV